MNFFPIKRRWAWNKAELHPQFAAMTPGLSLLIPMWDVGGDAVNLIDERSFPARSGTSWTNGPTGSQSTRTAGTNDHFHSNGSYQVADAGEDWTIFSFANPLGTIVSTTRNAGALFYQRRGSSAEQWGLLVNFNASGVESAGEFTPYLQNSAGSIAGAMVSNVVDGDWHAWGGRRSGSTLSAWVDGNQRASTATIGGTLHSATMTCQIGGINFSNYGINGSIAFVAVWQRALSDQEMVTLAADWNGLIERRRSLVSLWAAGMPVGAAAQGLTGAFLSSTATLYAATVTRGAVGLSPPQIASSAVLRQPTVTRGAVTITPPLLASTASLAQPTVTRGAVGISPPFLSPASILLLPTVAPGAVALTPPAIGSAAVLNPASLAYGVSPPIIVNIAALHQASVAPGAVTAAPPAIDSTASLAQPSLTTGPVTVTTATLASTAAAYAPTVAAGPVNLSPPHLAATTALYTPALRLNLLAATIASALALHTPTIAQGAVTLQPPAIDSTSALHEPSLATGPVSLLAAHLASGLALYTPSVGAGASSLEIDTIASAAALHAPALSLTLSLPIVPSTAVVHAVSLAYSLALPAIGATSNTYAPSLALTLALPSIGSNTGLYPPVLTAGSVLVALPVIESAEAVYGASLTSDGALSLVHVGSTAALYGPSLRLNLSTAHHGSTLALYGPALALNLASPHIALTETLYGPAVAIGAVTLQPPYLDSTAALHAAVLDTGRVVLAPSFIGSQAATFAPTLSLSLATAHRPSEEALHLPSLALNLSAGAIGSSADLYPPIVPPPSGGLATATIESAVVLHQPVIDTVSALVAAYLDGALATYAPSVARGPVTILLPHLDLTVILRPPTVIQGASGIAHRISVTLAFGARGRAQLELANHALVQAAASREGAAALAMTNRGALHLPSARRQRVQLRWTNDT